MALVTDNDAGQIAGTSATDIWVAAANNEEGDLILFNVSGATQTVLVRFYDGTNTVTWYNDSLATKERLEVTECKLKVGSKIIVTAGAASAIDWSVLRKQHA